MAHRSSFKPGMPGFKYVERHTLLAVQHGETHGETPKLGVVRNAGGNRGMEFCVEFALGRRTRRTRRTLERALPTWTPGTKVLRAYIRVADAVKQRFIYSPPVVDDDDKVDADAYCIVDYDVIDIRVCANVAGIYVVLFAKEAQFATLSYRAMPSTLPPNAYGSAAASALILNPPQDAVPPNDIDGNYFGRGTVYVTNSAMFRFVEAFVHTHIQRVKEYGDNAPILGRVNNNAGAGIEHCIDFVLGDALRQHLLAEHLPADALPHTTHIRVYVDIKPPVLHKIRAPLPVLATDAGLAAMLHAEHAKVLVIGRGMLHFDFEVCPDALYVVQ